MVVCASAQFTANGGILGLHRSAQARLVAEATQASTGDGPHGKHHPGLKTMIDQRVHWVNDFGVPVQVQVTIQRQRRTMLLSAPNYSFIRERYTHIVGYDTGSPILAPTPDPTNVWQTEWGGGIDVGVHSAGGGWKPNYGQFRLSTPESTLTLPVMRLTEGQAVDVRFRAALITPYTWWDNADDPKAESFAFGNTIRMLALPEAI